MHTLGRSVGDDDLDRAVADLVGNAAPAERRPVGRRGELDREVEHARQRVSPPIMARSGAPGSQPTAAQHDPAPPEAPRLLPQVRRLSPFGGKATRLPVPRSASDDVSTFRGDSVRGAGLRRWLTLAHGGDDFVERPKETSRQGGDATPRIPVGRVSVGKRPGVRLAAPARLLSSCSASTPSTDSRSIRS